MTTPEPIKPPLDAPIATVAISAGRLRAVVMGWGAVLQKLEMVRPQGPRLLTLGFARPDDYAAHSPHFGATAGRFANRIRDGRLTLDGQHLQLTRNQAGKHHLHGGYRGFGKRPWTVLAQAAGSVTLALVSPDGDEGYPGTLTAVCRYRLRDSATLRVELAAITDAPSPVNLVHHSYFNLDGGGDILQARLMIDADHYTPVDADLIPSGEIAAVAGTVFDFRRLRPIGHWVGSEPVPYDHNFVLRRSPQDSAGLSRAARLVAASGDLAMEVWTTEPGLQFYSGGKVTTAIAGHHGMPYGPFAGLCLEPQRFPDAPNHAHFPDAILRPGTVYRQVTEYRFSEVKPA